MLDKTLLALSHVMEDEYRMAVVKHGGTFSSPHEGYAVILEELEEAQGDLKTLDFLTDGLWACVKRDEYMDDDYLKRFRLRAIHAAGELIQVAAMVEKYRHSQDVWVEIEKEDALK